MFIHKNYAIIKHGSLRQMGFIKARYNRLQIALFYANFKYTFLYILG